MHRLQLHPATATLLALMTMSLLALVMYNLAQRTYLPAGPIDPAFAPVPRPSRSAPPLPEHAVAATQGLSNREREVRARRALPRVPFDPEATAAWLVGINDLEIPWRQRQDLLEDLNEVGFPATLTLENMPLIDQRIEFIDQYWPFAVDIYVSRGFAKARNDLVRTKAQLARLGTMPLIPPPASRPASRPAASAPATSPFTTAPVSR